MVSLQTWCSSMPVTARVGADVFRSSVKSRPLASVTSCVIGQEGLCIQAQAQRTVALDTGRVGVHRRFHREVEDQCHPLARHHCATAGRGAERESRRARLVCGGKGRLASKGQEARRRPPLEVGLLKEPGADERLRVDHECGALRAGSPAPRAGPCSMVTSRPSGRRPAPGRSDPPVTRSPGDGRLDPALRTAGSAVRPRDPG